MQTLELKKVQMIRCPNCGHPAVRSYAAEQTETRCSGCDYLLITSNRTGMVVESYAPGLTM